jgi:hypothetical protein
MYHQQNNFLKPSKTIFENEGLKRKKEEEEEMALGRCPFVPVQAQNFPYIMYIYKMFFPHCSAMSASYNQVSINVF